MEPEAAVGWERAGNLRPTATPEAPGRSKATGDGPATAPNSALPTRNAGPKRGLLPTPTRTARPWQLFLRRLDIGHTFRFLKQTLGWTALATIHPIGTNRQEVK
ncbi:hypothetical protein GCM10023081_14070 [Arthrobacter ginkgonis]|uniref:Transposase n=1 Tax=Arthrobacter ginkgonis TaxID=1630594 RepID=A0ABP7C5C5_9MICC